LISLFMASQQLIDYIRNERSAGLSWDTIQKQLVAAGLEEKDIQDAIKIVQDKQGIAQGNPSQVQQGSLQSPAHLLSAAWSIYRGNWKRYVGISLLMAVMSYLGVIVILLTFFIPLSLGAFTLNRFGAGEGGIILLGLIVFIGGFIGVLYSYFIVGWWTITLILMVHLRIKKQSIKELLRLSFKKVLPFWWVSGLAGFMLFGGLNLFLIPGILFLLWFSQSVNVVVIEGFGGMTALLRSKKYMEGYTLVVGWRLLNLMLIWFLIYIVIGILPLVGLLVTNPGSITSMLTVSDIKSFTKLSPIYSNIAGLAIMLILLPLTIAYTVLLFEDLRTAKGPFTLTVTAGRKLKYFLVASAGYLFFLFIFVILLIAAINPGKRMMLTRDNIRKTDLVTIRIALEDYYIENGSYPDDLDLLSPVYLKKLPHDPLNGSKYIFNLLRSGRGYELCANLEQGKKTCEGI